MSTQEEFARIQLQFIDPTQRDYEIIRPIVLFGETAAERSRQTGVERTVVGDKGPAGAFEQKPTVLNWRIPRRVSVSGFLRRATAVNVMGLGQSDAETA